MKQLTGSQIQTLDISRHISVVANAGSGKTSVIVERFLSAIRSGIGVEEILCLTFTDRAALELRERIGGALEERMNSSEPREIISRYRQAKSNMLEANISTIHSFCLNILREFPVEAGVDANFKVLEDLDAASLKRDSLEEAVIDSLSEETSFSRKTHQFLVRFGYRQTLDILGELFSHREKLEHKRIIYDVLGDGSGSPVPRKEMLIDHWRRLGKLIAEISRNSIRHSGRGKEVFLSAVESLEEFCNKTESNHLLLPQISRILESILTKGYQLRAGVEIFPNANFTDRQIYEILRSTYQILSGNDDPEGPPAMSVQQYLDDVHTIYDLYLAAEKRYNERKNSRGFLDFDDLQLFVLKLLKFNSTVSNVLSSRFKQIMVDEYQDTNFLQYDIFRVLMKDFSVGGRLFVVGDPKQSIYRFRNAQVEVFKKTEEDLRELQDSDVITLAESFRMNEQIAKFVDWLFADIMKTNPLYKLLGFKSTFEADYNPIKPVRTVSAASPVEIFYAGRRNQTDDSELTPIELQSNFVAARIKRMVENEEEISRNIDGVEVPSRIDYGDIAVLLRTRTHLASLENALKKHNIPHVVISGRGFYSSQEILDLTNYLTFLQDTYSDVSLLTVLRSPMFGISDEELLRISNASGECLFEKLKNFAASGVASEEVRYASEVLREETQFAYRLNIPQLLDRILARTGWLGTDFSVGGNQAGDTQRLANLRKLKEIARGFEGRGFSSLYDFVERIKDAKEEGDEGQASFEEMSNAVKILTIHSAKGLEFPVVFLPFCNTGVETKRKVIVNDDVGIIPLLDQGIPKEFAIYKKLEEINERAEVTRLFYVACTRAKDKLILATAEHTTKMSFAEILKEKVDLSSIVDGDLINCNGANVILYRSIPETKVGEEPEVKSSIQLGDIRIEGLSANVGGEIYSATVLQTYKICPTKYFLRYRIGLPTPEIVWDPDEASEFSDEILSTIKGRVIHKALQQLIPELSIVDNQMIAASVKNAILSERSIRLDQSKASDLMIDIERNIANAIETIGRLNLTGQIYVEQTITQKFGEDYLTGTIDLMVKSEKGFQIVDYKTNRIDRNIEEIYREYEIQMKLYALLCRMVNPDQKSVQATLVFTRKKNLSLSKTYQADELETFAGELQRLISELKSLEFGLEDLPTRTNHCKHCEFYSREGMRCLLGMGIKIN
ncbi:MAG: UvrD-helicase domain-containing protein [Candidatus Kryptoniota bacterium]